METTTFQSKTCFFNFLAKLFIIARFSNSIESHSFEISITLFSNAKHSLILSDPKIDPLHELESRALELGKLKFTLPLMRNVVTN